MKIITTKRNLFKFYLTIVLATLFYVGLGCLMYSVFLDKIRETPVQTKSYFIPLLIIFFLFMAIYTIIKYFKQAPIIQVDKEKIKFGSKETYDLKEIDEVLLTGKMPFKYFILFPMEGGAITFKNETIKCFYDDMYSNTWQLKSYLDQVVNKKKEYNAYDNQKHERVTVSYNEEFIFKNNQFLSLRGITLWGLVIPIIITLIVKGRDWQIAGHLFLIGFMIFWFFMSSWMMYYFVVKDDELIIKNHNYLWVKKVFQIDNIKEVVFESNGNQPNSLRVITKDYRNILYLAGTLNDKTWLSLKLKLEEKGIKVRNESIIEDED